LPVSVYESRTDAKLTSFFSLFIFRGALIRGAPREWNRIRFL
jgi:hypothetical protein